MSRQFVLLTGVLSALTFGGVFLATGPAVPAHSNASVDANVYYAGCDEARAAGVAPIYKGQLGYRVEMDGDNDGIACEPYRGGSSPNFRRRRHW